ncbi:integrase, catalytic region, zinc finger, CCHC-type containing protein [Tanacetum coccineum]
MRKMYVAARAEGNASNGNQIRCYNCRGLGHLARNCTVRPRRRDAAYLQTQLLIAQRKTAGIQLPSGGKPSLQPVRKNLVVRQPNAFQSEHTTSSKHRVPQKVDETNALSNPVTSNSVPSSRESTVVNNERVIAPGIFRINPVKANRKKEECSAFSALRVVMHKKKEKSSLFSLQ